MLVKTIRPELFHLKTRVSINVKKILTLINDIIEKSSPDNFPVILFSSESNYKDIVNRIYNYSPKDENDLYEWLRKISTSEQVGMQIAQIQKWNEELHEEISLLTDKIKKKVSLDDCYLSSSIIAGNYGYTPYGVHKDNDEFVAAIHYNLGPGEKHMALWKPDLFYQLTGSWKPYDRPIDIIDHADIYTYKQDEGFILPYDDYHIGFADEFSISIVSIVYEKKTTQTNSR